MWLKNKPRFRENFTVISCQFCWARDLTAISEDIRQFAESIPLVLPPAEKVGKFLEESANGADAENNPDANRASCITLLESDRLSVLLQIVQDSLILFISRSAGPECAGPTEGWQRTLHPTIPLLQHAWGTSTLFAANLQEQKLEKHEPHFYSAVLGALGRSGPAQPLGKAAWGTAGYLRHLWDHYYLFLVSAEGPEIRDGVFQVATFPLLELLRHKAARYDERLQESRGLIHAAVQATISEADGTTDAHRPGRRGSPLKEASRLQAQVKFSIEEMKVMAENVRRARQGFQNLCRDNQRLESGSLWADLDARIALREDSADHACRMASADLQKLELLPQLILPEQVESTFEDPFDRLFAVDDFLYKDLKERLGHWRMWIIHRWSFSKVPEMVLHDWKHVEHVYRIAGTLAGLLNPAERPFSPAELYCLAAAALLHDIGLSGGTARDTSGNTAPFRDYRNVRKVHSLIAYHFLSQDQRSADLLPDLCRVPVALLCLYHASLAPLNGGTNPVDLNAGDLSFHFDIGALQEKANITISKAPMEVRLKMLAAILRLADALDVDTDRAGDKVHLQVVQDHIAQEVGCGLDRLSRMGQPPSPALAERLRGFWQEADPQGLSQEISGIATGEPSAKEWLAYLGYLCAQPAHFRKHCCFQEVDIALRDHEGTRFLIARYPAAPGCGAEVVKASLDLLEQDLIREWDSLRSIPPFDSMEISVESTSGSVGKS